MCLLSSSSLRTVLRTVLLLHVTNSSVHCDSSDNKNTVKVPAIGLGKSPGTGKNDMPSHAKTCAMIIKQYKTDKTECVCLLSLLSVETHQTIISIYAQAITIHHNIPSMLYQEIIKSNSTTRKKVVSPATESPMEMSSQRLPGDVVLTDVCNFITSPVSS